MKTLILNHQGHEAHVPYELPDEVTVDCFVPEYGMYVAHVDLSCDEVMVTEVTGLPEWFCSHDAVLEQAGDVCAVFERALSGKTLLRDYQDEKAEPDSRILTTIAEMALLESDLHTAWCRLPFTIADIKLAPTQVTTEWAATKCLERFIHEVLVPRAQDLAAAAAKRRMRDRVADEEQRAHENARAERTDLAIDLMKERA